MSLHQILYVSAETHLHAQDDIDTLLEKSRKKNETLGVTGILIYYKKHFFQILEGNKEAIFDLFQTIRSDQRHMSVILVWDQPITERSFKHWSMAFINLNKVDKSRIGCFSEFLEKGFTSEITPQHLTVAQKLLLEFKDSL